MNHPSEAEKELERATQLGARGFQIFSNVNGRALDSAESLPLIEEMARRDLVMWLHPARGADFPDYASEDRSKHEIWWTFGWPYETSVAMARLVFAGVFDRWPDFRIITHHMGAMIPYFEGRVGYGWDQLGTRSSDGAKPDLRRRPFDYFKMFHADTALFGALAATRCGLEFFGADRVLFASDTPFEPSPGLYIRETIRVIESLGLAEVDKEKIYRGNAERLLGSGKMESC
jgi:aminocarboxymuconate-semialdehyde decarboxylase